MNLQNGTIGEKSDSEPSSSNKGGFWNWLKKILTTRNGDTSLKESLEGVIEEYEADDSSLREEERSIIKNTLAFGEKRADEVMVPRADIVAVEASTSFDELMKVFLEASTSRLPVYRESLDEVIAMVHIKDVFKTVASSGALYNGKMPPLKSLHRPILFVPPSMKLMDILVKMQATHIHMALVVDEYGGTDGLVTIEDLVEQIVGDIEDEHDVVAEELLSELPGGRLRADSRLTIEELEDLLSMDLLPDEQDDDVDTLGGLVFTLAGSIPKVGEIIEHENGLRFEILEGDGRRIKTILIHRPKPENMPQSDQAKGGDAGNGS
ncbi:hemolysin family protein [Emcibacter sp.]|uniref:hemolysin family protein n=1 Tax=Emcibacter sp. TaxID=1979954 RepID=UPI002AA790E2|nr:hemolysin family protein [Emcibacter sp.]